MSIPPRITINLGWGDVYAQRKAALQALADRFGLYGIGTLINAIADGALVVTEPANKGGSEEPNRSRYARRKRSIRVAENVARPPEPGGTGGT